MKTVLTPIEKRIKAINKAIAVKNKAFEAAKPAQKRVLLAKEVLSLLEHKVINPSGGTFLGIWEPPMKRVGNARERLVLSEAENPDDPKCTVCAVGALLCATFRINGDFELDEGYTLDSKLHTRTIVSVLSKFFQPMQIFAVEAAFEGRVRGLSGEFKSEEFTPVQDGESKLDAQWTLSNLGEVFQRTAYETPYPGEPTYDRESHRALYHIMKNIIRNKGTFKIEELPKTRIKKTKT